MNDDGGLAGLRRVLDALAPPDLRSVLRMAGAGRDFALGALLAVLSAWGIVAAPWLIGKAVNELKRTSTEHLALVALAVAGAGLLTAVLSGAALWLLGRFAAAAGARIRDLLYDHLLVASLDLFRTQPPASSSPARRRTSSRSSCCSPAASACSRSSRARSASRWWSCC